MMKNITGERVASEVNEKSGLINAILSESGDFTQNFASFIEQFYSSFSDDSVEQAGTLLCIARDIYKILETKIGNETKIKIFNPTVKDDGWQSGFTIIQILNTDIPFLVDSFTEEIKHNGYIIDQRINSVLGIKRDKSGRLEHVYSQEEKDGQTNESLIYFAINKINKSSIEALEKKIKGVAELVHAAVKDWKKMSLAASSAIQNLEKVSAKTEEIEEIKTFLKWMQSDNFVFLSYAEYLWNDKKLYVDEKSLLGMCKIIKSINDSHVFREYESSIYITMLDQISRVHRRVNMDCIRLKMFDESGKVIGERRFLGLFTSIVYYQNVRQIPIIRKKLDAIEKRAKFVKGAHNNKALVAIVQDFPRVELLHIALDDLYKTCMGILSLSIKPRFRLFVHRDSVGNFVRFITFVPNSQFSMKLWNSMKQYLLSKFQGSVCNEYIVIGESGLVRLQLIIKVKSLNCNVQNEELEQELAIMARDWDENLKDILNEKIETDCTKELCHQYIGAFPESYKEVFDPSAAYFDIQKLESISKERPIEADFYRLSDDYHLKIYFHKDKLQLYNLIPVIENMSMRVTEHYSYKIKKSGGMWVHHFILKPVQEILFPLEKFKDKFEFALIKILNNEIENDYYNNLIVLAGLDWREILLLRAFGKYIKQICFKYSSEYIKSALSHNPEACLLIIKLFHTRFSVSECNSPEEREEKIAILKGKIEMVLAGIKDVVSDRIIRMFVELCFAILRTNYYMQKEYVSFKISSRGISEMPLPKPFVEIYVYSNKFEGVHLRGGKVARGGIRWSDRTQDFRTEILSLMKAQMPKNAAIVPVGSKGGFILKDAPEDKQLRQKTAISCYQDFLRGLLDITDNIEDGRNVSPQSIIVYDDFDPYLVVAADKGTATFSNYANEVSKEYNFWLSDAFASGGSSGYDHKKLAITSSGAWVSMQLRFWEKFGSMKKVPFTVVGIGDMSGDVFGNGMLLSDKIKLIAAFNHIHIFFDPDPKMKDSFNERKRLFEMPGSTWLDYNPELISIGGGVFLRSSKIIEVTPEMRDAFGIYEDQISPNDLIKSILRADVDVIWNGGIGTYIKSSDESNESVGDKANDTLRIDGIEVRAKIIVEGGNVGCTQLGRIEYSKNGGLINTDFIDNCAGVCCSDMEVNIKIAFSPLIRNKKLAFAERDKVLFDMEKEVTELILNNTNKAQALLLMLESMGSKRQLEQHQLLLNKLEKIGLLDRKVEFLPTNEQIKKMFAEGVSLARPQLALLISYAKMHLYDRILASDLPDNNFFDTYLIKYFPSRMQKEYQEEILNHPLRREIIATHIANNIINKVGCSFINSIAENTGLSTKDIVRVLITVYELYKLGSFFHEVENVIGKVSVEVLKKIHTETLTFVNQTVYWFLRNYPQPMKIGLALAEFSHEIENINKNLPKILDTQSLEEYYSTLKDFIDSGVSEHLAKRIASLKFIGSAPSIIQTANNLRFYGKMQVTVLTTGKLYFQVGSTLYLTSLREMASKKCENGSYWQRISVKTLSEELYDKQMLFTSDVAKYLKEDEDYVSALDCWKENNISKLKRYEIFFNDIKTSGDFDVSKFVMLTKRLCSIATN